MLEEAATLPTRLETSACAGPGTGGGDGSSDPLRAALLSAALAHAAPNVAAEADTALSAMSDLLAPVAAESRRRGRGRPRSVSVLPQAPPITAPHATAEADAVVAHPCYLSQWAFHGAPWVELNSTAVTHDSPSRWHGSTPTCPRRSPPSLHRLGTEFAEVALPACQQLLNPQ